MSASNVRKRWAEEAQSFSNLVSAACDGDGCKPGDVYDDIDSCPACEQDLAVNDVRSFMVGIEWAASALGIIVNVVFPEPEEDWKR